MIVALKEVSLWCETFGRPNDPAVLLMMGNGCDATMWPDDFCRALAEHALYVVRFDQRDTGLSSSFDFASQPYTLMDMVQDAIGLLDALHVSKAHIVGYSTGGLIAQLLAIHYAGRVSSLILMMTSLDLTIKNDAFLGLDLSHAKLPPPKPEFIQGILQLKERPIPKNLEEKAAFLVENFHLANGSKAPFDGPYFKRLFTQSLSRTEGSLRLTGHESNHALATSATPVIQEQEFTQIQAPTLVINGAEDPIFPPAHAQALARAIHGAKQLQIEAMGHVLNPVFFDQIVKAIANHIRGVK